MTPAVSHPRYQLDSWIATGGMGEVWRSTDTLLDREVALKILKREFAEDEVLRRRFAAEARHAASLQHPNVASVLDYGEVEVPGARSLPFLVMELVAGQPLSALLADGEPLSESLCVSLIAQVAEGLQAAHDLGIVHRDVKPGNLLVTPAGQVKVTDFGVARAANAEPVTVSGHLVGTPHYLSPEQASGETATPASDVYALGIVLYECLTGRKPFDADTPVAIALKQIREPLPALPSSVPAELREVVERATRKDPTQRYSSAAAFGAALRGGPSTGGPPTLVAPAPPEDKRGRRRGLWWGTAVVALVAMMALVAGVIAAGRPTGRPVEPENPQQPAELSPISDQTGVGIQQGGLEPGVTLAEQEQAKPAHDKAQDKTQGKTQGKDTDKGKAKRKDKEKDTGKDPQQAPATGASSKSRGPRGRRAS